VGSGRYCVETTAELRVPLMAPFQGTLFFDHGPRARARHRRRRPRLPAAL